MERQLKLKKGITKRNGFNGALKPCKNVWNYKFTTNKKFIQKIPVKLSQDFVFKKISNLLDGRRHSSPKNPRI